MKHLFIALSAAAAMTFSTVAAASSDPETLKERLTSGMSPAQVVEIAGEPEAVKVVADKEVWVYPYVEEKAFAPDLKGEIQVQFSKDNQVAKVFSSDNSIWVWGAASLLMLAIIFI